jgi:hypothetical protein
MTTVLKSTEATSGPVIRWPTVRLGRGRRVG